MRDPEHSGPYGRSGSASRGVLVRETLRAEDHLMGFHPAYRDYFHLHLARHLGFLVERGFLVRPEAEEISAEIDPAFSGAPNTFSGTSFQPLNATIRLL